MSFVNKIFSLKSFQDQLLSATMESCRRSLSCFKDDIVFEIDWNNLITCASILGNSDDFEHMEAALRVAQSCLENSNSTVEQKFGAAVILDTLTNRQAISLAVQRNLITYDFDQYLPLPLRFDIAKRRVIQIYFTKKRELYLNRFQKAAFDSFQVSDVVSVSAPTSAGKSFILYQTVVKFLEELDYNTIIYIVPTRALIGQVERDFQRIIIEELLNNVSVITMPKFDTEDYSRKKILVFTQERLHWFIQEHKDVKIDCLIVDEAHKIADGYRGILLQQKLEEIVELYPKAKIFFSSPLTTNPDILYEDFPNSKVKTPINTQFVAVNQNLLFVSQIPRKPQKYSVEIRLKDSQSHIGIIELENRPTGEYKLFAMIANKIGSRTGNIIYVNGAAYAEKIANVLYDIEHLDLGSNEEILVLVDFCKKAIHKSYLLNKVLKKGIAFHYGNMPLLVRTEIERLFEKGVLKYLICTSTLLEGINLPAKNIFMRKPSRGINKPLQSTDFWNLAGRAGRLGKEFQGNIVCIEPASWQVQPSVTNKRHKITKAIDLIKSDPTTLFEFIDLGTPRETLYKNIVLEYAFTYLFSKFLNKRLEDTIGSDHPQLQQFQSTFEKISEQLEIPKFLIEKHPGISPIAQQNLLEHFYERIDSIEEYVPIYPEAKDAVESSYIRVIGNISKYLSGDPVQLNFYHAILVVNWMRGYPLSQVIDKNFDYWQKKDKSKKLDVVIRETMNDIEEFARFKFAKYSACYVDILRYFLNKVGRNDLLENLPDLHIWLEFGVSQQTQVSLIGIGLSRQTAISLSEFIVSDRLSKEECRAWILSNDVESLQLSELSKQEIRLALKLQQPSSNLD